MAALRFGPFGWESGNDWTSFTGSTGVTFGRTASGSGVYGLYAGVHNWVEGEIPDTVYLAGLAATAVEVSGSFLFTGITLTAGYANAAAAVAGGVIRFPWGIRTSGNTVLGEWITWKKTGTNQLQLTWRQRESGGSYVYGSDYGIEKNQVYRYRLRFHIGTSPNINRAFLQWGSDAGWSSQSVVQTSAPSGQADRVTFASIGSGSSGDSLQVLHDNLRVRSGVLSSELWDRAAAYLVFREASQRVGYTQRATAWRADREFLDARYEYRREGGCGKATFKLAAPRTLEAWTGQGFRNPDFGHKVSTTIQSWTQVASGTGAVANSADPYHTNAFELSLSGAGQAAIYQERATAPKTLVSGGVPVSLPTIAVERSYRVRARYKNTTGDWTGGIRIRVVNVSKSLEWSITERRWKDSSGFDKTENRFDSALEWTEAICEFQTQDGRLQSYDTYRIYIEADDSDGSPLVEVHVGEAYFEAWGPPPVYERLRGLENVGAVELWARREDGSKDTHLFDGGIETDFECVYSGFPIAWREGEDGRVEIQADGWSSILRDKVAGVVAAGQSVADILADLLTDLVDVTDGPFFTSSIGSGPVARIIDEFDTDGRSIESCIQELATLTPGIVSWGVDAAREFYFKAITNSYQHDPFGDNENTVYSVYVDREASGYKRSIDLSQLLTKVTVLGEEPEDGGPRPSATVECIRASELYGVRHREVIEDSLESEGECAKKAQLLLATDGRPKFKTELTLGPTRFMALQRTQTLAPIAVRELGRRGHSMASDGKVYSGGVGASILLDNSGTQYAHWTPATHITPSDPYMIQIRTAMPTAASGTTFCALSSGLAAGDKFLRFRITPLATGPETISITVAVGTVGLPSSWNTVWTHVTTDNAYRQTTIWTISKSSGASVALDVYANGGLLTPGASTAFVHGSTSGPWVVGASQSDTPAEFFDGKIDDVAIWTRAYSSSFFAGTSRISRAMGEDLISWITWDEATEPVYWRDQAGNYGQVTLVGSPTFTNALSGETGTGRRWGEGQTYGGAALLAPERIEMRFLGAQGWEANYELGSLASGIGSTLEQFDEELEKLREVVR